MNTENVTIDLNLQGAQQSQSALSGFTGVLLKTVAAHVALATAMGALRARGVDLDRTFERLGARLAGAGRTLEAGVAAGARSAGTALRGVGAAALFATPLIIGLAAGFAALATAMAGIKAAQEIRELAVEGAKVAPVRQAFDNLAVSVGDVGSVMQGNLRAATRGTVDDLSLMRSSVIALNSGAIKSPAVLNELASSARVLGRTVGLDTSKAFDNMIRGIGLMRPELLKTIGVLVSSDEAFRKHADTIGVSVSALTDEQKHEAFLVEVLDKVRGARDRATASTNRQIEAATAIADAIEQEAAARLNIRQSLGASVVQSDNVRGAIETQAAAWLLLQDAVRQNSASFSRWLDRGADAVQTSLQLAPLIGPLATALFNMAAGAREAASELDGLTAARVRFERAAGESGGRFGVAAPGSEGVLEALGIRTPHAADRANPTVIPAFQGFALASDELVASLGRAREQLEGLEFQADLLNATIGDSQPTDAQREQWEKIRDAIAAAAAQVAALGNAVRGLPAPNIGEPADPTRGIRRLDRDPKGALDGLVNTGIPTIESTLRGRDELRAVIAGPTILGDAADKGAKQMQTAAAVVAASMSAMAQIAVSGSDQAAGAIIGMIGQIVSATASGPWGAIIGAFGGLVGALTQDRDRPQPVRIVDLDPPAERKLQRHVNNYFLSNADEVERMASAQYHQRRFENRDGFERPF